MLNKKKKKLYLVAEHFLEV